MKNYDSCPYCQAERDGLSHPWGMSPEGWGWMKRLHDEGHKELEIQRPKPALKGSQVSSSKENK